MSKNPPEITRRSFLKTTGLSATGLLLLGPTSCASLLNRDEENAWWFAHLSDSHNGNPDANNSLKFVLQDIKAAFPQIEFAVTTGDLTEHGWGEELDQYKEIMEQSGLEYYAVLGNHDARWSRTGRRAFREHFGQTHWALHRTFASIIMLNSSILLEQYGNLDRYEMAWLEKQLDSNPGKPAFIGFHHPPAMASHFIGSDHNLFEIASKYNIPVIMAGHIHARRQFRVNGTWIVTSGSTISPENSYCVYKITEDSATLYDRNPASGKTKKVMTIPFSKDARGVPELSEIALQSVAIKHSSISFELPDSIARAKAKIELNGDPMADFQRDGSQVNIRPTDLNGGTYEILAITSDKTDKLQHRAWGKVEIPPAKNRLLWKTTLNAGIQCRPAFYKDKIITGTNAGTLYALSQQNGSTQWKQNFETQALLSSPVLNGDKLYFGTIDQKVYCLNPDTGGIHWKVPVDGSVIASGMFTEHALILGTGSGKLIAIDLDKAEIQWTFQTGNLIKATPAYDGERLYFGSWDGYFYCVNAETGKLVWKKYINTPQFAPATSNPKIYGNKVIFVSHDYRTHCLNKATGEVIWEFPAADVEYQWDSPIVTKTKPSYSSAIFYGGTAYFCSLTGHVIGFDIETGERNFELALDAPVFDSFPILVGNTMYFGTTHGGVCAVNLDTGSLEWEYSTGYDFIFSGPASNGNLLAIGNLGGQFSCFQI